MKNTKILLLHTAAALAVICVFTVVLRAGDPPAQDRQELLKAIDTLTGLKGEYLEKDDVYRVEFTRSDLKPVVMGVKLPPEMGLSVWAAFKFKGNNAMVLGGLVLFEEQVNPVISEVVDNGLEVTSLNSNFLWDSPRVMFMNIEGTGAPQELASAVGKVFAMIKSGQGTKKEKPVLAGINTAKNRLDPKIIEDMTGIKPQPSPNGVFKIVLGRTTSMANEDADAGMGVSTWAAFAGSNEAAVVSGDFAMLEDEVQPVLRALHSAGLYVTAIHHRMLMESPRIIFLHFWGSGSLSDLAKAFKTALDTQRIK